MPPKDDVDDSLWNSPVKPSQKSGTDQASGASNPEMSARSHHEGDVTRDTVLQQELASVRSVNEALEGVLRNLDKARTNMTTVNQTVGAASSLLNTWTRILSQTEHNQRLILDPSWHGATQDMADIDAESQAKQQSAVRREAEDQERKLVAARKAEEAEQKRLVEPTKQQKTSSRGRSHVSSRGASTTTRAASSGYGTTDTGTSTIGRGMYTSRRPAPGVGRIGRGISRGRG